MPLIAYNENGERVCSLDFENANQIRTLYPHKSLYCPFCESVMSPRESKRSILHFFHCNRCTSEILRHPESKEHLLGKQILADLLRKETKGLNVDILIEYPISNAGLHGRVADVAAVFPTGYVLIYECQLASITTENLEERTLDYEAEGCDVIWFFGKSADVPRNHEWAKSRFYCSHKLVFSYESRRETIEVK
jgi:competence CoiA-like predicted nuclease